MARFSLLLTVLLGMPMSYIAWIIKLPTKVCIARRMHTNSLLAKSKWLQNFEEMQELRRHKEEDAQDPLPKAKSRYVPPEQWNHTLDMSEEEKIRFDALRHGNQWQQNEILRNNLGS